MENRRIILYFTLIFIIFTLWTNWMRDYAPKQPQPTAAAPQTTVPNVANNQAAAPAAAATSMTQATQTTAAVQTPADRIISVQTDVLDLKIDLLGGNILQAALPAYPESTKNKQPVVLLTDNPEKYYVAQSGLTGPHGPDTQAGQVKYQATQTNYNLAPNQKELKVDLTWRNAEGLLVTKSIILERGSYAIHVTYQIKNDTKQPWTGNFYSQIRRIPESTSSWLHFSTYTGAAISTPDKPYQKVSFSKMEKENLDQTVRGGWVAMQQRYFLSAWIPNQQQTNRYYSSVDADKIATIGFIGPSTTVEPGQSTAITNTFYVGPEISSYLKPLAPGLDLTIDYGWLWVISVAIFWVMEKIYHFTGNWGWSIVLVTVLIKLVFYKLSETSYRSMAKMRNLQPKLADLKQRYGDDRQKFSQATMELYRKEKVNPLGGCLPILVQIPVFIALYYVLLESVQLRQAPFLFWIQDLSTRDPYFILPILMGVSMYIQQKLNPTPPDPVQARVMQFLPVVFTVFFLTFPAGLVLYWLTNNVLSILQQWYIIRKVEMQDAKKKA